ncbi:MAG: periplasmic heavy metal sensor [Desulfobaccales bacterium]
MKRDWLVYLVIFSLALNAGTIGSLVYMNWHGRPGPPPPPEEAPLPFRQLLRELDLDRQQRQTLKEIAPAHWRKVFELQGELVQQRQELFALIRQENLPEWPPVQAKIRGIGNLWVQLEEEKVHHLMAVQKNLRPEQRQVLIIQLEKRLPQCCPTEPGRGRGMMQRSRNGFGPGPSGPMGPPGFR